MIRLIDACGNIGKTLAVRLLPGTDLIEGMEDACKKHNIKHAYVSCFGSFSKVGYMYLVPKKEVKMKAGYGEVIEKEGPIEFLNGTGVVCQKEGCYDTHFHATMCDQTGTVFGGHIVKGTTTALTTVDLIIIELEKVEMLRTFDEETELVQFLPRNEK